MSYYNIYFILQYNFNFNNTVLTMPITARAMFALNLVFQGSMKLLSPYNIEPGKLNTSKLLLKL